MGVLGNNFLPFDPSRTSGRPRDAERFNGDGSNTTFQLSVSISNPTDLEVFVENVQQEPITAYDAFGRTLTFSEAPPSGTNNIYVIYRNTVADVYGSIPDGSITFSKLANNIRLFTTDNFIGDASTVSFSLSSEVPDANTLFVSVDGVFQRAPIHYTTSNNTITFSSAPPASSNVHVRHLGFRTTQSVTAIPAGTTISQPVLQSPTITGGTANISANISYTGTLTGNTGVINIGTGQLFKDASGNVGIGTSTPSAKLQVAGGLTLGGQLNLGSTGQIVFPATQNASANANTLDDYEEGTWTPGVGNQTVSGSFSSNGAYTKIGRQVFFRGQVIGSTSITGAAGTFITGLPFTSTASGTGSGTIANQTAGAIIFIGPSDTNVYIIGGYSATGNFEFAGMYFA